MINYQTIKYNRLKDLISTIKDFRASEFSPPPYSYAFDEIAEKEYLEGYTNNKESVCITASTNNQIVGLVTGMPLNTGAIITSGAKENFKKNGKDIDDYFYICEIIVLPHHRDKGIGKNLLRKIEDYALTIEKNNMALLSIKDEKMKKTGPLWEKLGYKKLNIFETHHWPTYLPNGKIADVPHHLTYWTKKIKP